MNLFNYLSTINRLWNNEDGSVAKFVSINGNHAKNPNLWVNNPQEGVSRVIQSPILAEVLVNHLKVISYLNCDRKSFKFVLVLSFHDNFFPFQRLNTKMHIFFKQPVSKL